MKITKLGHSCFLVEDNNVKVLFDPGDYVIIENSIRNLQAIIITHSHSDHFDLGNIRTLVKDNPECKIITNTQVSDLLKNENYKIDVVENEKSTDLRGMEIEAIGNEHMAIYSGVVTPQCTGYYINKKLFNTADNFNKLDRDVEILIAPFTAPWFKLSEYLDYVKAIKPKKVLAAHDGNMKDATGFCKKIAAILMDSGIEFINMDLNKDYEL